MYTQIAAIVGGVAALGALYVLLPVARDVYNRFKRLRLVRCPETDRETSIQVDAARAARTALVGRPKLKVRDCARWPARKGCGERCLSQLA